MFLDDLASNLPQPQTLLPTRVCKNSKTFIDNILSNLTNPPSKTAFSVITLSSISDYLPQYFIYFFPNSTPTKYNIMPHN